MNPLAIALSTVSVQGTSFARRQIPVAAVWIRATVGMATNLSSGC